jgi:single-strand DNA-binding protein
MLNGGYQVIVGNAVDDFDLRFTPGGAAVGDVTLALNSRAQIDGEWADRDDPAFVKVTVWWEQAENCAETISRGDRVLACGEWYIRKWLTRDDEERISIEMTADEIGPALRFAQAKITKMGRTDRDDDRDDDRRDRGGRDRGNRGGRGRESGGRGGSRSQRTNDRGSRSERRGSSGRDDRDDRRGGGRSRRDDDRGNSRGGGRRARSVWDDDEAPLPEDDPGSDLPDDPNF